MTAQRKTGGAGEQLTLNDRCSVLAQLAGLKTMEVVALKARWRELFGSEPPPYNRAFLESRLAYRVQELAFGGLAASTVQRLEALAGVAVAKAGAARSGARRPIAGTRLVREWQGTEHTVTVLAYGFDYAGRPYKSLSAVARSITGTRWNGWLFFGLKGRRA